MFILVEVIEREISVTKYDTLGEAQYAMKNNLCEALGVESFADIDEYEDCGIYKTSAWANTNNPGNCDWTIFDLSKI